MKKPTKFILPDTRDALHSFLIDKVRLNRYDNKFMANIWTKYISVKKPLSINQNELYEKIVHKYRKQLKKLGINWREIKEMPWQHGIVDLDQLTQKTYFKLQENASGVTEMRLYFTFNKKHIDEVRALVHDDEGTHFNCGIAETKFGSGGKYNFEWDNQNKVWYGPFSLYLFKELYKFAVSKGVQIDSAVQDLVSELNAHGSKQDWTPSVRIVHGRMYVSHVTEEMLPALESIDPTDLSVRNIERMTKLGLDAPAEVVRIAEYVDSNTPRTEHLIQSEFDVIQLREYIEKSGRKAIYYEPNTYGQTKKLLSPDVVSGWNNAMITPISRGTNELIRDGYDTLITTVPHTRLFHTQDEVGKFALEADKIIYINVTNDNGNNTNK